jgi:thiol-disulfide isomerase/thioredoxin
MKKLTSLFLVLLVSLFSAQALASEVDSKLDKVKHASQAEDIVTLHFFWSKDCPHCSAAHPFINKLKAEYPWLKVKEYDVTGHHSHNGQLFEKMAREHGKETSFVPTFFVCDKMIVGYTSAKTTGAEIRDAILECHNRKH